MISSSPLEDALRALLREELDAYSLRETRVRAERRLRAFVTEKFGTKYEVRFLPNGPCSILRSHGSEQAEVDLIFRTWASIKQEEGLDG